MARQALGTTSPNPAVGAVVVRDGSIVGEGFTQPPGQAHAEVVALGQAGDRARGATMYVSLEPCCHYGRTPPCTQAIIAAGIAEVHMAIQDPNPLVAGKGQLDLERAGIRTVVGERAEEAREVNEAYLKFITTGLPFVVAKYAMSLDGKIATWAGDSQWISNEESRKRVMDIRLLVDAIMVGVNTIIRDDPRLTVRQGEVAIRCPLRVIVDSQGRTPVSARALQEPGHTILAVAHPLASPKARSLTEAGAEILEMPPRQGWVDLPQLLKALGEREVTSLLVEGGGTLLGSLFDIGLVDKVYAFISPIIIGGSQAKTPVEGEGVSLLSQAQHLHRLRVERLGDDVLIVGYPEPPAQAEGEAK